MKKLTVSLLKQLTLLSALIVTTSFLIFNTPNGSTLFMLQIGLGILYLIFSIAEFSGSLAKMNLPFDRFFYLPYSIVSNKLIKLGAYTLAAGVLWVSYSGLRFLSILLFIIIVADLLVFLLRIKQKVYYVSLFANYILIALEHEQKVFASSVETIEYRYDIFYLKLKDRSTISLVTDRLAENQKQLFTDKFVQWALRNQVSFTEEAREKLKQSIHA